MGWDLTLYSKLPVEEAEKIVEQIREEFPDTVNTGNLGCRKIQFPDREFFNECFSHRVSPEDQKLFDECQSLVEISKPDYSEPGEVKVLRAYVERLAPTMTVDDAGHPCTGEHFVVQLDAPAPKFDLEMLKNLASKFSLPFSISSTPEPIAVPFDVDKTLLHRVRICHLAQLADQTEDYWLVVEANLPLLENPKLEARNSLVTQFPGQIVEADLVLTSKGKNVCRLSHTVWHDAIEPVELGTPFNPVNRMSYLSFAYGESYYLGIPFEQNSKEVDWVRLRVADVEKMWKALLPKVEIHPKPYAQQLYDPIPRVRKWISSRFPALVEKTRLNVSLEKEKWILDVAGLPALGADQVDELRFLLTTKSGIKEGQVFVLRSGSQQIEVTGEGYKDYEIDLDSPAPRKVLAYLETRVKALVKKKDAVKIKPLAMSVGVYVKLEVDASDAPAIYGKTQSTLWDLQVDVGLEGACAGVPFCSIKVEEK